MSNGSARVAAAVLGVAMDIFAGMSGLTAVMAVDSADGWLGIAMSALAGVAAALAVAVALNVYFRRRYRTARDVFKHGLAALAVLGLLAFIAYDMRHAAQAYLGINPSKPAVEFEIRLPTAAVLASAGYQAGEPSPLPIRSSS